MARAWPAVQGVEVGQLELAYAITVHKAQGGEAQHVVLALSPAHGRMLTRRLLYTGALAAPSGRARGVALVAGLRKLAGNAAPFDARTAS